MKTIWRRDYPSRPQIVYIASFALIFLLGVLYCTAGGNAVVTAHDQLDQFYMGIYVEHFSDGFAPELMNGLPISQVQTVSKIFIPLYFLFDAAHAYLISYAITLIISYIGMALLCSSLGIRPWVSALASSMYALLPFFSTYGLSVMGIPLLTYGVLSYWVNPSKMSFIRMLAIVMVFALGSGLVFVGYACLIFLFAALLASIMQKPRNMKRIAGLFVAIILLCIVYSVENIDLLLQFLSHSDSSASHREEFVDSPLPATFDAVLKFLEFGQEHGVSNQYFIFFFSFAIASFAFCLLAIDSLYQSSSNALEISKDNIRLSRTIILLFIVAIAIACFYVFFHSGPVTSFRNTLPGFLRSFQFDRFYLFYPTLWYLLFGLGAELLLRISRFQPFKVISLFTVCLVVLGTLGITLPENDMMQTLRRETNSNQSVSIENVTWNEFFGEALFEKIKEDNPSIENDGKVVSIGLFPSIALFNGLQCLDGYMTNYPLDYKHDFREIIEGELNKSSSLATYYDDWGSRFYIFSSEIPSFYTTKNSGSSITNLNINVQKFREMGGKYLLSAMPIDNADDLGLVSLGEYEANDVPFEIFLYKIRDASFSVDMEGITQDHRLAQVSFTLSESQDK